MLEKKGSCTSSALTSLQSQEEDPPLGAILDTESSIIENGLLTSTDGERLSPSNKSSSSSTSHHSSNNYTKSLKNNETILLPAEFHHENSNGSVCGSAASSSGGGGGGKRSKSKESYHSSDEVIDEEDLLATISDSDYDPLIPAPADMNNAKRVGLGGNISDGDSAFEDSHYSGSSDDKNKKGSVQTHESSKQHVMRNKSSRKRSTKPSSSCEENENDNHHGSEDYKQKHQHQYHHKHERISEMTSAKEDDFEGEKEITCKFMGATLPGGGHVRNNRKSDLLILTNPDYDEEMDELASKAFFSPSSDDDLFHHPNEPEPILFEMEVSPANKNHEIMPGMEGQDRKPFDQVASYQRQLSHEFNYRQNSQDGEKRIVEDEHVGQIESQEAGAPSSSSLNDLYVIEEDLDAHGHPRTILLPPPEVRLSPDELEGEAPVDQASCLSGIRGAGNSSIAEPLVNQHLLKSSKVAVMISDAGIQLTDKTDADGEVRRGSSSGGAANGNFLALPGRDSEENGISSGSQEVNEDEYEVQYVVPDGGWGWMVLFGSIIVNILIPGTVKSFGVLFVEFLEVFEASPAAAAWIPALSYWLYSSMGPFASALAMRYSHRAVTIAGGILASLGLMLSYFATSISYLYVSYGIIGGLGAGMAYPIGVFMVGQYFEKRRGLANGLCTSGSALGSVIIPPFLRYLLVEYGYRGAILIMGGILLNVCVGAMFYDPVSKHMKKIFVLRKKETPNADETRPEETEQSVPKTAPPARRVTSPIPRAVQPAPIREVAASMPIAIPLPAQNIDFREVIRDRRASNSGRRATFQIGHDTDTPQGESWSFKSNDIASPLAARLVKEDQSGACSPKWSLYNPNVIRVRGHLPYSNESNPELEVLIHSNSSGMMTTPGGTTLSLSAMGTSRGQSRLNLTAIPEDDDTASESTSRQVDWQFYSALPPAKQRLLRLSMGGGTQLMGSHAPSSSAMISQTGLSRTMSVASNVSSSSFHYMSTIHHGSLLTAMQMDKNLPEFASTLTLKSVRQSCCPRLSTLKGICRKLTCGLWPKLQSIDERDQGLTTSTTGEEATRTEPVTRRNSDRLKKFIDLSLLKDGMYLIMLLSNSTTAIGYTNFIVLLPSYALALGFDKSEAAFLLSIVALFDFFGRIGGAALSDLQFISRKWFYIVGLFFSGVALSLLPIARTYFNLSVMCSCFGLASGTYIGVTAVILADQLGAEKLGSSYGISLFLNGLLQLIGPPICGVLLQNIGRFEPILMWLGITLIFGAMMWIFAPFIERRRALKAEEAERAVATTEEVERCPGGDASTTQVIPKTGQQSETSVV